MDDYKKKNQEIPTKGQKKKTHLICLLISFLLGTHSALPLGGLMEKHDCLEVGSYTKQEETTEILPSSVWGHMCLHGVCALPQKPPV